MPNPVPSGQANHPPIPLSPLLRVEPEPPLLPSPLAQFVGRVRELATARELLLQPEVRLLTLTGPGGAGKTRLALRVAEEVAHQFPDGVAFVPLAPMSEPGLVIPAVARALGLREGSDQPAEERLVPLLRERRLLLLLDNLEHLIESGPAIGALLEACPQVKVLATSRAALGVYGEQIFPVPPLDLPARLGEIAAASEVSGLAAVDAVRLFVVRARAAQPEFALTEANAAAVAAICRRLDGLPLAIELAAARSGHLTPATLLSRLEQRLPLLSGGPRDQPARLRTMRDAITWSYDLLTPNEQILFRRLSVFVGGFTLEAAERVGGRLVVPSLASDLRPPTSVLDLVASLVSKSMVIVDARREQQSRYTMLETLREFGLERLKESDEEEEARRQHAAYVLALAERAEPELLGPNQGFWLDRLDLEFDNLRTALEWTLDRGNPEDGLRLAEALFWFWIKRVHLTAGREWIERVLAATVAIPTPTRVKALMAAGSLAVLHGDGETAIRRHETALSEAITLGEQPLEALAMTSLGGVLLSAGKPEGAKWLEQALVLHREGENEFGEALALYQLGLDALARGQGDRAMALCEAAVAKFRAVGDWWFTIYALSIRGMVWLVRGQPVRAQTAFMDSASLARQQGEQWLMHQPLTGLALVASVAGTSERAVRLLAASEALAATVGGVNMAPYRTLIDRALDDTRSRLGSAAFAAVWESGRKLTLADAVEEAISGIDAPAPAPVLNPDAFPAKQLTPRELMVLRLLVEGRSDREIAAALCVSPRTATTHVTSILGKFGVTSRTAAAAIAVRRGLA